MINKTQEQIMATWKEKDPLVTIKCLAYNHQLFIEQAMDGFLSQITNFAFEIIVHDDASTDGTSQIIRQYEQQFPDIVKPIYQTENQYSKHTHAISKIIHQNTRGRYIALCDGDDYWIDEKKLQKQMDCMLKHSDCGLCFTDFNIWYQKKELMCTNLMMEHPEQYPCDYTLEQWILYPGYTAPMTWLYTAELYETFERLNSMDFSFEFFAHALATSKVICLKNETTAVYRVGHESAVHTSMPNKAYKRAKSLHDVRIVMIKKYRISEDVLEKVNQMYYNKAYRLIAINHDVEEIKQAKKYCRGFLRNVILCLANISFFRTLMSKVYRKTHQYNA